MSMVKQALGTSCRACGLNGWRRIYGDKQQAPAIIASLQMDAATPPDDAIESSADTAGSSGSGGGGSGDSPTVGNRLVDMERPVPDPGF